MPRVVIDVRTPSEYAGQHVEGAINLDLRGASFATMLVEYPKGWEWEYVVYCNAGRRAGAARSRMIDAGFLDVTSYGLLGAAAATGAPIVSTQ